LLLPACAAAQTWRVPGGTPAYREGYVRGQQAGVEDARRRHDYNYRDESDYRRGDAGYSQQNGSRDRYRDDFRRGFESGYRVGYSRDGRYGYPAPARGAIAPGARRGGYAYDPAFDQGYTDGYEAGLKDARDRRAFDPISEGRYRDGDRGYERSYGSKDVYKANYRSAFRRGYEDGYQGGRRYDW
jgi:hypothetical protein